MRRRRLEAGFSLGTASDCRVPADRDEGGADTVHRQDGGAEEQLGLGSIGMWAAYERCAPFVGSGERCPQADCTMIACLTGVYSGLLFFRLLPAAGRRPMTG